ncbi:uncharacterized protein V1518DRAFT_411122 [Limtongia smithiae]|uniref:uncharacterized protein n=1 Tax=Limtongia smithiae TaxID=1125753 RepID=UPI0034CDE268
MSRPVLRHVHLSKPGSPVSYSDVARLQELLVRERLDFKRGSRTPTTTNHTHPPPPVILTMEFAPVYTFGRRQSLDSDTARIISAISRAVPDAVTVFAERGGQTTFHGPGQLVAYPVLDLVQFALTPRCYIRALENAAMTTLAEPPFEIPSKLTDDTGVWFADLDETRKRKIASVGVHMRRNVTSHGIAINCETDLTYFNHIIACGIPDAEATSVKQLRESEWAAYGTNDDDGDRVHSFASLFVHNLAKLLKADVVRASLPTPDA